MRFPGKLSSAVSAALIGTSLIAGSVQFIPSFAGEQRSATDDRPWLSIGQVSQKLESAGYRNVEKIEREHGVYEARASDRHGARIKVYINPQTGEITEKRQDRRQRDSDSADDSRPRDGKYAANCNERRCRDDLPGSANPKPASSGTAK